MKFSKKWLNEYVDLDDVSNEELRDRLTLSGFEVESIENLGEKLSNIVVAKITKIYKHPNADTLQVCEANIGYKSLQIITRATNVFEGAFVPLALDGAKLLDGTMIKPTKMRGLDSFGMFCGKNEIGIQDDSQSEEGIYIIKDNVIAGQSIASVLGKDDVIFDITILSNRPDCNSIYAMATEIAGILDREIKPLDLTYKTINKKCAEEVSIEIKSDNCLYYSGCIVDNVKIMQSPKFMQERLASVGIRPINAIVDITNYVLIEIGQPMHAFDFNNLKDGKIVVRQAKEDEEIQVLNEETYKLNSNVLVICDDEKPVAMAGIMGGLHSSINTDTKKMLFESATFKRGNIRKTVRSFGLSSASSARYERGVVPAFCELGLNRALHFISEFGIGDIYKESIIEENYIKPNLKIEASTKKIIKKIGMALTQKQIMDFLKRLGLRCEIIDEDRFVCESTPYRNDLEGEQDLVEEIVRLYGFEKIPTRLMDNVSYSIIKNTEKFDNECKLRNLLIGEGLCEVIGQTLENENLQEKLGLDAHNIVRISNPLSEEFKVMRPISITTMLNIICYNNNHSNKNLKLFEIGKNYAFIDDNYIENQVLTMAFTNKKADFFEVKNWLEIIANSFDFTLKYIQDAEKPFLNPYKSAKLFRKGKEVGYVGEVHPRVLQNFNILEDAVIAVLNIEDLLDNTTELKKFIPYTKFQPVVRDLTFLVPNDMQYATLYQELKDSSSKYCTKIDLVDIYSGQNVKEGYKSFTFKFIFEKLDSTFTDDEMQSIVNKLLKALKYKLDITLKDEV